MNDNLKAAIAAGTAIVRHVRVDRNLAPMGGDKSYGRKNFLNEEVVASMPQYAEDEVDVYFIPIKGTLPVKDVAAFLAQYGLLSSPHAQAAVNEQDPTFADEHPNFSQWGDNCYLVFNRWLGVRYVGCDRDDDDWDDCWFVSGVLAL